MTTHLCVYAKFSKYRRLLINKHNKVINEVHMHCLNRGTAPVQHGRRVEMSPSGRVTLTWEGTLKPKLVWHWQVLQISIKPRVSSVRPFVCCFDLLPATAPPHMCGGEHAPPPLNTFPHINKPYRCRNAWGPALTQLLEFSPLIKPNVWDVFHLRSPVSTHTDSQKQHKPPAHLLAPRYLSAHGPQARGRRSESGDKMVVKDTHRFKL